MSESSSKGSRIEGVLRDATTDLQNAELPGIVGNTLVPVTTKASDIVANVIPSPFVDRVGAFALSVPLKAVKLGYSLIPHDKDQEQADRRPKEFMAALEIAGIDLDAEYQKLNLEANNQESDKLASFQDQEITFLVEVIGCENLIASDIMNSSSDPYVRVKFGSKLLHATKHQSKSLNPVYTLRKDALFLWSTSIKDLFLGGVTAGVKGLTIEVCDFDSMTSDDVLGTAVVPPKDIYNAHEERLVYPLLIDGKDGFYVESGGSIAIRIRRATEDDKKFLATYQEYDERNETSGLLQKKEKKQKRGQHGISFFQSMLETKVKTFVEDGKKIEKYKVLPFPDPELFSDTDSSTSPPSDHTDTDASESGDPMWKTEDEIECNTLKPSRRYQHIGSGKIARVYLEVLACNNLPNMENIQAFGRNKTDAFVQVVYEDCICRTDVIDDKNNPRFLPWTNRAFVLHSRFPSSVINLGVFDYDPGDGIVHDHDFIGRASVDLSSLRPGTEYLLDYKLYDTALLGARKDNGTIKVGARTNQFEITRYCILWHFYIIMKGLKTHGFDMFLSSSAAF
jgi:hypothetical protein